MLLHNFLTFSIIVIYNNKKIYILNSLVHCTGTKTSNCAYYMFLCRFNIRFFAHVIDFGQNFKEDKF